MQILNELLFISSAVIIVIFDYIALYLGKDFLVASIVTQGLLANIFIIKQVSLFGLSVTCTDVFIIGIVLAINLLEEVYGKDASNKAVMSYLFSLLLVFSFKYLHLWYLPSANDFSQIHYQALFETSTRIILATFAVSFFSLQLDRFLYRLLSRYLGVSYLPFKNFFTTAVSQLLDTILFSWLALRGIVANMSHLIIFSYLVKILSLLVVTIMLSLTKSFIKQQKNWNKDN